MEAAAQSITPARLETWQRLAQSSQEAAQAITTRGRGASVSRVFPQRKRPPTKAAFHANTISQRNSDQGWFTPARAVRSSSGSNLICVAVPTDGPIESYCPMNQAGNQAFVRCLCPVLLFSYDKEE